MRLQFGKQPSPAAEQKPFFRADVNTSGEFEILIYEEIGEYFDWDTYSMAGITAKSVRQSLDSAGTYSKIKLRINSPGGDAFEGVAIGNVLKSAKKPIDVYIDGIAASAASIIAMCGSPIVMASNAMIMIHKAWSYCVGNSDDMRKMGDTLDAIDSGAIAQAYVDRTGKPMAEILAMMAEETWLSARQCVELGFATAIAETSNDPAIAMAKGFKALSKMRRVPESLRPNDAGKPPVVDPPALAPSAAASSDGCKCACEGCMDGNCSACSNEDCTDKNCIDCPMQTDEDLNQAAAELDLVGAMSMSVSVRLSDFNKV